MNNRNFGEEASKGSITQGKLADLMILDKNPLKVENMQLKISKYMKQ